LGVDYIIGPIGGTYDWGVPTTAAKTTAITSLTSTASGVQFQFQTVAGRKYRLEGTDNPASRKWETLLDNIKGTDELIKFTDPGVIDGSRYFYRMVEE
jgi:hypothetical protein